MTDRYENIRKALEMGPTPGPWVQDGDGVTADDEDVAVAMCCPSDAEAAFIAACDPDTIRALLEERDQIAAALEAAREDAERLDWLASESPPLWVSRDRGGYELPYFDITSGRECCDPGDLRAAIDQARRKENGNG